jgi:hypothetical protein
MKKHIAILLILLLAISTQTFASSKENMLTNDEKVEVAEKTQVTNDNESLMETELQQNNQDTKEKLDVSGLEEISNRLDEDDSSVAETLCWVCSKYVYSENPKFYVCVDGYWSKNCMIK